MICKALSSNSSLVFLSLEGAWFGTPSICELTSQLVSNKSLSELNLAENDIRNEGTIAITRASMVNNTVTSLLLANGAIDENGLSELIEIVKSSTNLVNYELFGFWEDRNHNFYETLKRNRRLANQASLSLICVCFSKMCRQSSVFDGSVVTLCFQFLV